MKNFTNQPSLLLRWSALLLSWVLYLTVGLSASQAQMKVRPGILDTCYASPEIMNTKVYAERELEEMERLRRGVEARMAAPADELPPTKTAEFIVEYNDFTPEAQAAFQYAVDIWSTIVVSDVPIRVQASFTPLPPGALGAAGPRFIFYDFSENVESDTWYPSALADAIAGEDLAETIDSVANAPDIQAFFSSTFGWYYGTDLNPPNDQFDFVTVVLHELGHGLGFVGGGEVNDSTGLGSVRINEPYLPLIYDRFVENGAGVDILDFSDPSKELANQLTSGDLFMTGKNAVAALGGSEPELFAPSEWIPGSSYSHWDEDTFAPGDSNSLMTPRVGFAESIHRVGDITKGLFKDMGWTINEEPVALISLRHTAKASPGRACLGPVPTTDEIGVIPGKTVCLYYTVTNVGDLPLTLHSLKDTQSGVILSDVEQVLPPGESLTVTRQIRVRKKDLPFTNVATWTASNPGEVGEVSATAVTKLFYAPVAKIRPNKEVQVKAKQGERRIKTLRIANRGGTPLVYSTVIRETDTSFEDRVAASQTVMAQQKVATSSSLRAWSPSAAVTDEVSGFASIPFNGEALRTVQYATDFENFTLGPLGVQNGWVGTDDTLALVSDENAFSGEKHLRMLSDSTKDNYSIFSPGISGGDEPYSSFAVKLNLLDEGAQYRIFPSEIANGALSIGAGILIAPNRAVFVFASGQYRNTGYVLPERYVELKYVSDRVNETYDLYIDDQLIASGVPSFSSIVNVVEFRCYNAGAELGVALDIDDFEIIDGDAAAPGWVAVEPAADTVPVNTQLNADIIFDAQGLEPGVYRAEITVLTNDPFNPSATIPVQLTVKGKPSRTESLDLKELILVDAEKDRKIRRLKDGDVLDLSRLPDITVAAIPTDRDFDGYMLFFVNGKRVERQAIAPYALAGDGAGGDYFPYPFEPGDYELKVISYAETNDDEPRVDSITVNIEVIEGEGAVAHARQSDSAGKGISYTAYPNPVVQSFSIRADDASEPIVHYALIDNLGRVLSATVVDDRTSLEIDMNPYLSRIRSAGIFYLKVITKNGNSRTIPMQLE